MKCKSLFSWENQKIITNLSTAEFAQRGVKHSNTMLQGLKDINNADVTFQTPMYCIYPKHSNRQAGANNVEFLLLSLHRTFVL